MVSFGLPSVSVPVLSTTSVFTFSMVSSASAFLISTPACSTPSGADHDGHRRGQSQRAGAGDDEYRHRIDDGVRQSRFRPPDAPCRQRDERGQYHRRNEISGDDIGQVLDRCARTLRFAHHVHDLREQCVGADFFGAHQQTAGAVHRGADQACVLVFFDRDGFAGDHGFVQ